MTQTQARVQAWERLFHCAKGVWRNNNHKHPSFSLFLVLACAYACVRLRSVKTKRSIKYNREIWNVWPIKAFVPDSLRLSIRKKGMADAVINFGAYMSTLVFTSISYLCLCLRLCLLALVLENNSLKGGMGWEHRSHDCSYMAQNVAR